MSKKRGSDALEDAMAEALQSVEKREAERSDVAPGEHGAGAGVEVEVAASEGEQGPADAVSAELTRQLEVKTEELSAAKEQMLRLAADFDNFRKRAARDSEEVRKFGIERLAREMLSVIDNLDRALEHATKSDPVVDGVKMVAKQFLDVLGQFGIRPFSAKDQPFDPERHEAISQQAVDGVDAGTVVSELQRGYMLHERLLRPARVIIAAPAADTGEDAQVRH